MAEGDGRWHFDKTVPLGLMFGLAVNVVFCVWFAAKLDSRVTALENASPTAIAEFTKLESARETSNVAIARIETKLDSILQISRRLDTKRTGDPDGFEGPH